MTEAINWENVMIDDTSVVRLAAYVGKGDLFNAAIRRRTGSRMSHCEIIIDGLWYSASLRDRGVRRKHVDPKPGEWEYQTLPWADAKKIILWFDENEEVKYGIGDIVFQLVRLNLDAPGEVCSTACAAALDFLNAFKYNPKTLWNACRSKTLAWEAARS